VGERVEVDKLEDGLYQARGGLINKLDIEDDGLKKIRVTSEAFEAVRSVQKQMRKLLGGRKPDVNLVAEAMLLHAAKAEGIDEKVRQYAVKVFSGEQ
jgi:hypothetical protein